MGLDSAFRQELDDLEETLIVLAQDVEDYRKVLEPERKASPMVAENQQVRRAYVRAIFALVEAALAGQRRVLVLFNSRKLILLTPADLILINEEHYVVDSKGIVGQRPQYLPFLPKVRYLQNVAARAFGLDLGVRFDDAGWECFKGGTRMRNRLMHPKQWSDCDVSDDDLTSVDTGEKWFRDAHNAFVRAALLRLDPIPAMPTP